MPVEPERQDFLLIEWFDRYSQFRRRMHHIAQRIERQVSVALQKEPCAGYACPDNALEASECPPSQAPAG